MLVENVFCDVAKVVVRSGASEISAIHENAECSKMYTSSSVQCFLTFLNCWDPGGRVASGGGRAALLHSYSLSLDEKSFVFWTKLHRPL